MPWRYVKDETKIKEGRGLGRGKDYKPWIRFGETGSEGTGCIQPDWKHGRGIQCLSRGELFAYALLRWEDDVEDILEQYPLNPLVIEKIAFRLGIKPGGGNIGRMTTDFVVIRYGGSVEAYSIKASRKVFEDNENDSSEQRRKKKRIRELQMMERIYWEAQQVEFRQLFTDEMDKVKALNILDVVSRYNLESDMDDFAKVRYLIAHKIIEVDMSAKIDYRNLIKELRGVIL